MTIEPLEPEVPVPAVDDAALSANPYEAPSAPNTLQPDEESEAQSEEAAAREWLEHVYQGDHVRQLSVRSIITGMLIGGVMSISNLYVGLKTGWGLGVTITACIVAYAVFKALEAVVPRYRRDPFTVLENYTMSSAASAAAYMSSAGLVSALPALYMATGRQLLWWEIMSWLGAVSVLGVFMAIPLKRQLINIDKLPFPSGIATAETLKSMHTEGTEAMDKARSLMWAAVGGAFLAFWRDAWASVCLWVGNTIGAAQAAAGGKFLAKLAFPSEFPLFPGAVGHDLLKKLTIGFEGSLIMIAAGAIMGIRVGVSLLIGAAIYYGVLAPVLINLGIVGPGYREIVGWTLWPATAMMVTSGLLSFAFRWRTVLRAFSGLGAMFGSKPRGNDALAHVEVPGSWFVVGTLVSGTACVLLGHFRFGITWWMGILAVLLTFVLSIVAARATGETDVTPVGAMGKITQLMYGFIAPTSITTNLMTASITAGASAHSADLLTDLKSGYLLGGNPRKQTISQLFGVLAGTLVCVPVYLIVAQPSKLGTEELPAPAARVWEGVALMIANTFGGNQTQPASSPSDGKSAPASGPSVTPKAETPQLSAEPAKAGAERKKKRLDQSAMIAMAIGAAIGILLTLVEEFSPPGTRKWLPSVTGLGIAGVIPAFNSISMFLGALVAWILSKVSPAMAEKYVVPVSSGLIAGESLMAVSILLWQEAPGLYAEMQSYFATLFSGGS
ncbi:MAG TPA: OPT family oligopeptide transporter [Pirellulales bacterium]